MKGPRSRLSTTALGPWQAAAARGFRRSFEKFCTSMKCAGSQVLKIFLKVLNGKRLKRAPRFVKRVKDFQSKPFTTARAKSSS